MALEKTRYWCRWPAPGDRPMDEVPEKQQKLMPEPKKMLLG